MKTTKFILFVYMFIALLYLSKTSFSHVLHPKLKQFLNNNYYDLFFACYVIIVYYYYTH